MAEIIEKTGKSYNIFDKINNVWNKCSFWTHSNDVFYPDGKSATTKHSAINGITSDLSGEAEDIAASIKCVNQLNNSLGGLSFYEDETGKYVVGADSVPKKLGSGIIRKLGTGRSFNIASIVGEENLAKYSADNFLVVCENFNIGTAGALYCGQNGVSIYAEHSASNFVLSYDKNTGKLTITGGTINTYLYYQVSSSGTTNGTNYPVSLTPTVYFLDSIEIE